MIDPALGSLRRDLHRYRNSGGSSGISAYAIGRDFIVVEFKSGSGDRYDYSAPGRKDVEAMKKLARHGDHLATYINQNVRENYAARLW